MGLLFGFSLASHDTVLASGQEKYFCEIDCHLAYAVLATKALPAPDGMRYIVTLRTRFDETTISSNRPRDYPLRPSPRTAWLTDDQGGRYVPESAGGTPLLTSLIPGQSYTTELAFTVPSNANGLRLLIGTTPTWRDQLLIGDENSWLHKKTYFQLETITGIQSANR